jgi:hypothetical protein
VVSHYQHYLYCLLQAVELGPTIGAVAVIFIAANICLIASVRPIKSFSQWNRDKYHL